MPCPTNSRTTEKPCASTCCWIAWPMSEIRAAQPDLLDAFLERLTRDPQQRRRFFRHPPDRHRDRRVAIEAVQLHAHVERDDVSLDQRARRRDPVDHLLVHRRAQRRGIAAIALERRLGAAGRAPAARPPASRSRVVTPGATMRRKFRQDVGHERVRSAHPLELGRRLAHNHSAHPAVCALQAPRSSAASTAAVTTSGGRLPSIDVNDRAAGVVLDERLRLPQIHLQPLPHDLNPVVHARDERAAALAARRSSIRAPRSMPHLLQIRRVASRRTSTSSGTTMSSTTSGPRPATMPIQRGRLHDRPRKSVEHEPAARIRPVQPILARWRS